MHDHVNITHRSPCTKGHPHHTRDADVVDKETKFDGSASYECEDDFSSGKTVDYTSDLTDCIHGGARNHLSRMQTNASGSPEASFLQLCNHKTSRMCSQRGRNGFSPYKKGSCEITQ